MKQPEGIEHINWNGFESDDQIKSELKKLVHEVHVSSTALRSKTKEEVEQVIKEYIASKGFPSTVSVSVGEPNEAGQRIIMGMAHSPLTGKTISF